MSKSLQTITYETLELEKALIENEGVLPPELEQMFDLTQGELQQKVDNYKNMIDALNARAKYFKDFEDQAYAMRKVFENKASALKSRMKESMQAMGRQDLEGHDWRFKLSPRGAKLVLDKDLLPSEFLTPVTVYEPNKAAIEQALIEGQTVRGATLEPVDTLNCYANTKKLTKTVKPKT